MLEAKEAVEASWTLPLKLVVVASPSEERLDLRDGVSGRRNGNGQSLGEFLMRSVKARWTTGEVQNGFHQLTLADGRQQCVAPKVPTDPSEAQVA